MHASLRQGVEAAHLHNYLQKLYQARMDGQLGFQFHLTANHQEGPQMGEVRARVIFRRAKRRCSFQSFHQQALHALRLRLHQSELQLFLFPILYKLLLFLQLSHLY